MKISDEALIALLKFLWPQQLKLVIYSNYNLACLQRLVPYLGGMFYQISFKPSFLGVDVTKLNLIHCNSKLINCLCSLFPQLKELECDFNVLMLLDFPVLSLNKLTIHWFNANILGNSKNISITNLNILDKMSRLFRHDIKVLDLNINNIRKLNIK